MKKIISILISILFFVFSFSFIAFAQEPVSLTLTGEEVYAGDEITLHLYVSGNSNISGATIDINYDDTKLEFVSAKEGAILDPKANISIRNIKKDNTYVRFTYLSASSSIISEGILMSVNFKALETAYGETELKLTIPEPDDFISLDLTKLSYDVNNSKVVIINDNVVESIEDKTEVNTGENAGVEESITTETEEQGSGDNIINIILVSALLIGFLLFIVGIVVIKKNKKS